MGASDSLVYLFFRCKHRHIKRVAFFSPKNAFLKGETSLGYKYCAKWQPGLFRTAHRKRSEWEGERKGGAGHQDVFFIPEPVLGHFFVKKSVRG